VSHLKGQIVKGVSGILMKIIAQLLSATVVDSSKAISSVLVSPQTICKEEADFLFMKAAIQGVVCRQTS
jgi:hypothetical protein